MVWTLHYGIAGNRARNGIVIPNKVHISLIFKKKDCFFPKTVGFKWIG